MHGVGWRLPVHELPTWPTLSPVGGVCLLQYSNMHMKQHFAHVHESYTMPVHHADGIQHMPASEALVGLGLVVRLPGLDEPVVPPRFRVLPTGPAAALLLGVAEDRQLLLYRRRVVGTSIVW